MTDIPPGATPIIAGPAPEVPTADPTFWYALVDEWVAAEFVHVVARTMQGWRQKGGGPRFVRVSARCVRYRRIDLKQWADERLRTSTSDKNPEPAAVRTSPSDPDPEATPDPEAPSGALSGAVSAELPP